MAKKVMVVDDDKISVALIKFALANARYDLCLAYDGAQALAKMEKEKPELIILDIGMPEMNGYEFITELKSIQGMEMTPVIVVTANETLEKVLKLEGVKEYFVKPVDLPVLLEKVKQYIGPADDYEQ